jgi:hypothetical protein
MPALPANGHGEVAGWRALTEAIGIAMAEMGEAGGTPPMSP